jgi:hypothetical protein
MDDVQKRKKNTRHGTVHTQKAALNLLKAALSLSLSLSRSFFFIFIIIFFDEKTPVSARAGAGPC